MILQVVRPGQLFGETAVASGGKHSEEARALEDSLYLSVPVARIRHVLGEDSTLSIQFLEILSHRLVESRQRAADLAFNTNPRRLAKFLLEEARLRGVRNNGSMHLRLGLTHEQLAQTIGTSREIVTSILNNLRRQAIIDYQGNSYSIFPEKLERFLSPLA